MSRRKCALLSLVVMLVGTLALGAPGGPCARLMDDQPGVPDESPFSQDAATPLLQTLAGLLPQIEIDAGSKTDCPECQDAKQRPTLDTAPLQNALDEIFPDSHLKVVATADDAIAVVGQVECAQDIAAVLDIAEKFHGNVVNRIEVIGPQQVQLRLLIAEVARGKLDGSGIKLSADAQQNSKSDGRLELKFSPDCSVAFGKVANVDELRGFLRALKQEGHAKIIAEPTLVTFTGRPASMVSGREYPIIIPGEQGTFSVESREYGTRIECLPIVLGKNRIRLQVRPELTSLDFANGVLHGGFIVPSIIQRRIDTSIELQSGETYVAAGISSDTKTPSNQGSSLAANAWHIRIAIGTCLSGLIPCPPCIPDQALIEATRAIAEQNKEPTDLIVLVTADLVEPLKPGAAGKHAATGHRPYAHPQPVAIPSDSELFQAGAEMDVDQPHAPAILLTPLDKHPNDTYCSDRPRVRLSEARVGTSPSPRILFGVGADSDAGLVGDIALAESEAIGTVRRDNCCAKSDRCQPGSATCCRQAEQIEQLHPGECDDECDDEEDDACDAAHAVESFILHVLQSQVQYLEGMMRVRLQHEKDLMEAKAAADSALAKQKAEHAEEVMNLRLEHMAEILSLQEAIWDSERKAMADRHRDAIEHERELAELRANHVEELQAQRVAALESEVNRLRGQAGASEAERVAHAPDDVGLQSSAARRPVLVELPIHVEDLTSGRVRYSPVPPKPGAPAAAAGPQDGVERVELTTPPISATRPTPSEIETLRREIARLHALIDDLVCIAPEAPPSPKPQSSVEDDDD